MKYRVRNSRFDVAETVSAEFNAENDDVAKGRFQEMAALPMNSWDRMILECVVQPEVTRQIAVNANLQEVLDH